MQYTDCIYLRAYSRTRNNSQLSSWRYQPSQSLIKSLSPPPWFNLKHNTRNMHKPISWTFKRNKNSLLLLTTTIIQNILLSIQIVKERRKGNIFRQCARKHPRTLMIQFLFHLQYKYCLFSLEICAIVGGNFQFVNIQD